MSRSAAKRSLWLPDQISTAQRNLSEWPHWMKEASKFERKRGGQIVSRKPSQTQRVTRKTK
jgi:hypothetical protein